ncbi:MAG: trigger factor [Candidatus Krumholzibacteria bacterium]|nr:trigger factor [Candidatus Krumholzibacteria bacterium]
MDGKFLDNEISIRIMEEKGCQKVISVEISPERFESEKGRVLKEMAKEVAIPGFRKGKVPIEVVERRLAGEIKSEALRNMLPQAYEHVIAEKGLEPVADPEFRDVKVNDEGSISFTVCLEVFPRFEIESYRDIKVEREEIAIADEEVNEVVKNLQERSADFQKVDRAAVSGDVVTLDFTPIEDGGTVDVKNRVTNYPVELGTGQIFPAFEEAVMGKRIGESGKIAIDYPKDYKPERLAGKKIEYEFTVNDVREKHMSALDDEFAAKIDSRFKTLAELKEDVRLRLLEEKEKEARRQREERAVDIIIERNPFDIPKSMQERFKKELQSEDERRREMAGVAKESDAEKQGQIDEFFDRIALRNIKRYFVMERIAEKEGIDVSEADLDRELQQIAEENGRQAEDIKKLFMKDHDRIANLKNRLRERKIFEVILGASS